MAKPSNALVCGDTVYAMTPHYIAGAISARNGESFRGNPHRHGSQRSHDWQAGFENECAGEHFRFGRDLLSVYAEQGQSFEPDPSVPRCKETGEVELDWYRAMLRSEAQVAA